jgi:hypothetical protein
MMIKDLNFALPYGLKQLIVHGKIKACLTGSRRFGGATHESDWDVFVQDSHETRRFFNDAWTGFTMVPESQLYNEQYDDPEIALLYRCKDHLTGAMVDVQLVRSFNHKLLAQQWILSRFPTGYLKSIGKQNAKWIWRVAYEITRADAERIDQEEQK